MPLHISHCRWTTGWRPWSARCTRQRRRSRPRRPTRGRPSGNWRTCRSRMRPSLASATIYAISLGKTSVNQLHILLPRYNILYYWRTTLYVQNLPFACLESALDHVHKSPKGTNSEAQCYGHLTLSPKVADFRCLYNLHNACLGVMMLITLLHGPYDNKFTTYIIYIINK